jgi:NADH-quinone oxidoreductase subunit N
MQPADFLAILPLIAVSGTAIVVMVLIALRRSHLATAVLSALGLAAAFASLWAAAGVTPRTVTGLLTVNASVLFYAGLLIAAAFVVVVLSYGYFEKLSGRREELYILILVALTGALVLVASRHLVALFLGLELLSVPLYGMIAYLPEQRLSLEAGLKYLILAAAAAAFLLFGAGLIYAQVGVLELARLVVLIQQATGPGSMLLLAGLALVITGLGFKLAVVPFHLWTPDVYQGAPAPVTAFIASVSKGAIMALLIGVFAPARESAAVTVVFTIIAIASMTAGNVLALLQDNVKRLLAYSSIAHIGYMLVGFLAGGEMAATAVAYYLVAYFITILGAFGTIGALANSHGEPESLADYRGLFWRRPALGAVFTFMLLSLAGVPITAGFFAKYYVLAAGVSATVWLLAVVLVVTSAVGAFYYLRVLVALYSRPDGRREVRYEPLLSWAERVLLGALAGLLLYLGVFPNLLLALIRRTAG